jgi:hypothetical protein
MSKELIQEAINRLKNIDDIAARMYRVILESDIDIKYFNIEKKDNYIMVTPKREIIWEISYFSNITYNLEALCLKEKTGKLGNYKSITIYKGIRSKPSELFSITADDLMPLLLMEMISNQKYIGQNFAALHDKLFGIAEYIDETKTCSDEKIKSLDAE